MAWREDFVIRMGGGTFSGITFGRWLRLLGENDFAVEPPYWGRAAAITLSSLANSLRAWHENRRFGQQIRDTKVVAPLFILGIWRSGTTLLHNLLAQDDRFAFSNHYQVCFPETFLTTEQDQAPFVQVFLPPTRPQDNMAIGVADPQEDEFAFCSLTGRTVVTGWAFPRNADRYDRYLTLAEASPAEVTEWKAALYHFAQKLTFKYGRPLVLKSPGHTARIKLLLELFPDARFVHIRRNPYDVYPSTIHTMRKVAPWLALQRPRPQDVPARALRQYRQAYDAFFAERSAIPPDHFYEVAYEALEADPVGAVRGVYEALALPDFKVVEPTMRRYVDSLVGYQKNKFTQLPADVRERVAREWHRCFEEWGYPT